MITKRIVLYILLIVLLLVPLSGAAQDDAMPQEEEEESGPTSSYSLGDQMFSINAGIFVPLFFFGGETAARTNLSIGGAGSLEWSAFLNSHLSLGGELAGCFSFSPLGRTLAIIPVTVKLSYFFFPYPFEIPIFLGGGVNFVTLEDSVYIGPILKPGMSFYWNINGTWAAGINLVYWFSPQWYTKQELISQSRYGNFLEITLSALYHF